MDKEEKASLIALVGFISVFIIYTFNAYAYVALALSYKVDLLIPFKVIIFVGLGFTIFFSVLNILTNEESPHPLVLGLEIVLLVASAVGVYFTVTSIYGRSAEFQMPFDYGLFVGCIIGIVLGLIGLGAATYVIFFRNR
jgi:hypothetical protein